MLLLDGHPATGRAVAEGLSALGYAVRSYADGADACAAVDQPRPDLAILDAWTFGSESLTIYRRLRQEETAWQTPIILLYPAEELQRIRMLGRRIELDEYVGRPFPIAELLLRARTLLVKSGRLASEQDSSTADGWPVPPRGQVVAVFSAKGGAGKTTIAVNLAVAIQQSGAAQVAMLDGNFHFGNLATALSLSPERNVSRLIASAGRIARRRSAARWSVTRRGCGSSQHRPARSLRSGSTPPWCGRWWSGCASASTW